MHCVARKKFKAVSEVMTVNDTKIDIVYTWVDGNDPKWLEKKGQYFHADEKYKNCIKDQISEERYSDNQELLYSMRSVEYFAPWVNHIYIVTDQQSPSWLKDCKNITIIDHTDIIPEQYLPTFNSSVIEAHLQNIPNLSEQFIYFNDDMLLGRKTIPSDFFKKGKPKVFTSSLLPSHKKPRNKENATYNMLSIQHGRQSVESHTGKLVNFGLKHGVRPLLKSTMLESYDIYHDEIEPFLHDKFRAKPFSLLYFCTFYALAKGNAVPKYMKSLKKKPLINIFKGFSYINKKNIESFSDSFDTIQPLVFCINETSKPLNEITLFSEGFFSKKGKFEK